MRNFPRSPEQTQVAHVRLISDGYFETLGIPLRQGRLLQASDMRSGAPPVAVLNETLARQAFGEANPIGQFITVAQRTHEIGLRMALGATAGDVLRLVMSHGSRLTVAGIVLGAAASLGVTRVLASMLFEVKPRDPATLAGAAVVLGSAAVLAVLVPARRATRVEPLRSLSGE